MCNGLADHVGFEREIATDGGFSRRRFLAAAAALSGLPVSTAEVVADSGSNDTGAVTVTMAQTTATARS